MSDGMTDCARAARVDKAFEEWWEKVGRITFSPPLKMYFQICGDGHVEIDNYDFGWYASAGDEKEARKEMRKYIEYRVFQARKLMKRVK